MISANTVEPARICVVITAFNCEAFIDDAIQSVLAQTMPVDEIVVIDDGSTDQTAAIVQSYAPAGVRYIYQENAGAGAARNRGIAETSGEFVAFLDGDDLWVEDKIERQVTFLQDHPDVVLVTGDKCYWNTFTGERRIDRYGVGRGQDVLREVTIRNVVGNPSMVTLRRSILIKSGLFDTESRSSPEDWELWIRIAACGEIRHLPGTVVIYRWHSNNVTRRNRAERIALSLEISKRAISAYHSPWWRPVLAARAWSRARFLEASRGLPQSTPRLQRLSYAVPSLLAYPLDDTLAKLALIGHTLLGRKAYKQFITPLRRLLRPAVDS